MYEVRPGYWISTWGCFTDEAMAASDHATGAKAGSIA